MTGAARLKTTQDIGADNPAVRRLLELYAHGGCIRVPNMRLRKSRTRLERRKYKKGYEIRFLVETTHELARLQQLLKSLELKIASPYRKSPKIVQPLYGRAVVQWFQSLLE